MSGEGVDFLKLKLGELLLRSGIAKFHVTATHTGWQTRAIGNEAAVIGSLRQQLTQQLAYQFLCSGQPPVQHATSFDSFTLSADVYLFAGAQLDELLKDAYYKGASDARAAITPKDVQS